jgi:hypothetical protein
MHRKSLRITKSAAILLLLALAVTPAEMAIASIGPNIPPDQMPPEVRPLVPIPRFIDLPLPIPDPLGPMTLERLNHITVSGVLYKALFDQASTPANVSTSSVASNVANSTDAPRSRLHIRTDAFGGTTTNVSSDQDQDVEPTTAAVNINGTLHTATVTTKYVACWNDATALCTTLYAYHTTNLQTYSTRFACKCL